jgi:hypothetical protein
MKHPVLRHLLPRGRHGHRPGRSGGLMPKQMAAPGSRDPDSLGRKSSATADSGRLLSASPPSPTQAWARSFCFAHSPPRSSCCSPIGSAERGTSWLD